MKFRPDRERASDFLRFTACQERLIENSCFLITFVAHVAVCQDAVLYLLKDNLCHWTNNFVFESGTMIIYNFLLKS